MNTLILLLDRASTWSPEAWACQQGGERGDDGQIMLELSPGWLSVLHDSRVLDDYDVDECNVLATLLTDPVPFVIEWKGGHLLKALIQAVPPEASAVVDNDHGVIAPVRKIRDLPIESWVRATSLP